MHTFVFCSQSFIRMIFHGCDQRAQLRCVNHTEAFEDALGKNTDSKDELRSNSTPPQVQVLTVCPAQLSNFSSSPSTAAISFWEEKKSS